MSTCLYFAFGSNMLKERLCVADRCTVAWPLGPAIAEGYRVTMWKRSTRDGSGKATLVKAEGHVAHGVLYEIALDELPLLDKSEGVGHGYDRMDSLPVRLGEKALAAHTYIAPPAYLDDSLTPFDWYAALCIAGAMQHEVPKHHIDALSAIPARQDADLTRATRQRALAILRQAGFSALADKCEPANPPAPGQVLPPVS